MTVVEASPRIAMCAKTPNKPSLWGWLTHKGIFNKPSSEETGRELWSLYRVSEQEVA
jgi:hypothetical protein